jgi:hypothetical protein
MRRSWALLGGRPVGSRRRDGWHVGVHHTDGTPGAATCASGLSADPAELPKPGQALEVVGTGSPLVCLITRAEG